jgi:hypothetical protein
MNYRKEKKYKKQNKKLGKRPEDRDTQKNER